MKFILALLLIPSLTFGAMSDVDRQEIKHKNLLAPYNSGFENGKAQWTASGGTFATTTTSPLFGKAHATWDSNGAAQTLSSKAVTIPVGFRGNNGLATCFVQTPSGTSTHLLQVYDGTNILVSNTIVSNTNAIPQTVNFPFPSSGSVRVRLVSVAADEPSIAVDDCHLGLASNLTDVSQATMYGSLKYANVASCAWNTGDTGANFTEFSADTDCNAPSVAGNASAPSTKVPRIKFASLPPGEYLVVMTGHMQAETGTVAVSMGFQLTDGTSASGDGLITIGSSADANRMNVLIGRFTYTTAQTNIEFRPVAYSTSNSNDPHLVNNDAGYNLEFMVYRFPTTSEQGYRPDQSPASWSGYHDSTCSWSTTSGTTVDPSDDATCGFTELKNMNFGTVSSPGTESPAVTFTPSRAGRYLVIASTALGNNAGAGNRTTLHLADGSNNELAEQGTAIATSTAYIPITLVGILNATSTAAQTVKLRLRTSGGTTGFFTSDGSSRSINWTIVALDQSFPAPNIINSITSSSSGGERLERVEVAATCSSTPCTITRSSGGASSITRASTGNYTLNFSAGTFSGLPTCTCTVDVGNSKQCQLTATSATVVPFLTTDLAANLADSGFNILCMGPR